MKNLSQFKILMISFLTIGILLPSLGRAQKASGEVKRWTLQEWLETRDRNRMMDLWLSMNSPSPFEFMATGSLWNYGVSSAGGAETKYDSYIGGLSANAQFIGLSVEHQNNSKENYSDLTGSFRIRLLGNSYQSSNLNFGVGSRTRIENSSGAANSVRNITTEADLQVYLSKYFGIRGQYRYFEPADNTLLGGSLGGTQTRAGLFIDFNKIRIFGNSLTESTTLKTPGSESTTIRTGIESGLMIFY